MKIYGSRLSPFVEGVADLAVSGQLEAADDELSPETRDAIRRRPELGRVHEARRAGDRRLSAMRNAVLALAIGWLGLAGASAARADEAFFRRCEVERRAALVGADTAALARLMADGAQYGHSNGETDDEASLIRRVASGELRYRSIVADQEQYACSAASCEVTGVQTLGVSAAGRELSVRNQFRATWLRAGEACSLVAYQSSPLPMRGK